MIRPIDDMLADLRTLVESTDRRTMTPGPIPSPPWPLKPDPFAGARPPINGIPTDPNPFPRFHLFRRNKHTTSRGDR